MKIKAKITMLLSDAGMKIELEDDDACVRFVEIRLTPEQVCAAMGRLACCDVASCEVRGLDRIGKKHECERFKVEISKWHDAEEAKKQTLELCPKGWVPDLSFNSQGSFSEFEGKYYASSIIRRWVPKEES